MREFPHLGDTRYPNFDNVDVYSFKNTFDYTRWAPNTKIHLCNVLWDSDYENVVKFDSNDARDIYFSNLDDTYTLILDTDCRIVPDGYVKLPLPYDVMARYNYMWLELPIATNEEEMIEYETGNGIRKWFFFIDGARYLAPNTTQVYVSFDAWTNHINDMVFTYGMLERGHAPVNATDTDTFLNDPIRNNQYLLADDVNYGNDSIVRSNNYIPFGNGKKYALMLCTVSLSDLSTLGSVTDNNDYVYQRPLTYSNLDGRQGYQLQVNNYGIGDGRDFSQQSTQVSYGDNSSNGQLINNVSAIAILASDYKQFITKIASDCPAFLNSIKCLCMVDENMITLGASRLFFDYVVWSVQANSIVAPGIRLEKSMFNIPTNLQRFTKLYTFPYSVIELTDNNGKVVEVKVENISSDSKQYIDVSLAFPYLNTRVFFSGINGVGANTYIWQNINGSKSVVLGNGDWKENSFDFDIPTFALFMDGETAYNLRNFNRTIKNTREQALIAYHCGVRDANTARQNALDANAMAKTNADNTADTQHTNAYSDGITAKTNANNMANTNKVNQDNNAKLITDNTANDVATALANKILTQSGNTTNTTLTNNANNDILGLKRGQATRNNQYANAMIQYTTQVQNEAAIATTQNNNDTAITSGIMEGVMKGGATGAVGGVGGAIAGAALFGLMGAVVPSINAEGNTVNCTIATQTSQSVANATTANNDDLLTAANYYAQQIQIVKNTLQGNHVINNNAILDSQTENQTNTATANATNTANTIKTNAENTKNTADTNAQNTYNNTLQVADNNKVTANANAANTKSVGDANATYTRENAILNLKERLEGSQNTAQNAMLDARNDAPVQIAEYSGDFAPDYYGTKGVQIKVRTQNDSAIKQAGAQFARYGYMLNQEWDVATSGLNIMKYFTYWKFSDIWLDDINATNNSAQIIVAGILKKGVTVWKDPKRIGKVNIYDN